MPAVAISGPESAEAATRGAGATVTETVTGLNLATAYTAIFSASGTREGDWQQVSFEGKGIVILSEHFAHSGDDLKVVDNIANPSVSAQSAPVTITDPPPTLALSNPGTVQEATPGAGVTVTETLTSSGLATAYAAVFTAAGAQEGDWQTVTFDAGGQATVSAHLASSGDDLKVVDNIANPSVSAQSAPVTITDPPPTLALSNPGTVQEATPGAGVTVTETLTSSGLATAYAAVFTAAGAQEGDWQTVTFDAGGQATVSAHLASSGDDLKVVDNIANPSVSAQSAPVTITDPPPTLALSNPGTVQEATPGAGVTVTETLTSSGLATAYAAVFTAAGAQEGDWQTVTFDAGGQATVSAHLASSGDDLKVVDNIANPSVSAQSAPVTITDPPPTLALSNPGTVQEATPGAGVTVTETLTSSGLATAYAAVFTAAGAQEGDWQTVTFDAGGQATVSAHLASSGDDLKVVDNIANPSVSAQSAPVTITDPPPTGTVSTPFVEHKGLVAVSSPAAVATTAEMTMIPIGAATSADTMISTPITAAKEATTSTSASLPATDRFTLDSTTSNISYKTASQITFSNNLKPISPEFSSLLLKHLSVLPTHSDLKSDSSADHLYGHDYQDGTAWNSNDISEHQKSDVHSLSDLHDSHHAASHHLFSVDSNHF